MCVMKMKKLTTFVACAAMAGVFATSAFAANDAQVARAQDYLNSSTLLPLLMLTRLLLLATLPTAWLPRQTSCWTVQSLIPKVQRTRLSAS